MDRTAFLSHVRDHLFQGRISTSALAGLERTLDYWRDNHPEISDAQMAYVLATAQHETAGRMTPVTEFGSQAYLRRKKYWPWIGRGLVQITWEVNYRKFGLTEAAQALEWPHALDIMFRGMRDGMFTGKKLSDYISASKADYTGARRIINGTDKARLIAGYAKEYALAFKLARKMEKTNA